MIKITIISSNYKALDEFAEKIRKTALKMGLKYSGPTKLPTKEVVIPYKRGMYKTTWDMFRMRLYKCWIEVNGDERFMKQLSGLGIPDKVFMTVRVE